ncbi:hypothetical protein MXB_329, partial [Myxobolus squamalis]
IAVEGNISAGKSTLLQYIPKIFPDVQTIPEPVDLWSNVGNHNLLLNLITSMFGLMQQVFNFNSYVNIKTYRFIERCSYSAGDVFGKYLLK